jgi:long-chain acyl-CoA synthetase
MNQLAEPATIPARLLARSKQRPDAIALELVGVGRLTFGEWEHQSAAVAAGLVAHGVRPGDRVALTCDTDTWIDYAIAYAAVLRCGAVAVPLLRRFGSPHLAAVVARSRAVGLIGDVTLHGVWSRSAADLAEAGPVRQEVEISPGDPAEVLYTSGTTGEPKGVRATHANLLATHLPTDGTCASRTTIHASPPGLTAGQTLLLLTLHPRPNTVITLARFDPRDFLRAIGDYGPDTVVISPSTALSLLRQDDLGLEGINLASVSLVRMIAAPSTPATLTRVAELFERAVIRNSYTSTEAWPTSISMVFDPARPTALGRGERGAEVRVVAADGSPLGPHVPGGVQLRTVGAPRREYDDDGSRDVFLSDGWIRTGDLGYLDRDGYLYLLDRDDDLVITGGLNLSTLETEQVAAEFSGVAEAVAFGVAHPTLGNYLALAVAGSADLSTDALEDFLDERLGEARAPKRVVLVDTIPRGPQGKPLKRELRAHYSRLWGDEGRHDDGDTNQVDRMRSLWAAALDLPTVPDEHSFLALGGDSFRAMTLLGAVTAQFGRTVRQRLLYRAAGVRQFAEFVAAAPVARACDQTPIPRLARDRDETGV